MVKVLHYVSEDGADHFDRWLRKQSSEARARIQTRIDRVELGNFGDHRSVGEGVYELRIDFGPGYRVYYGGDGDKFVILLVGGTKKRQARDIAAARNLWSAYKQEKRDANKNA
ncbi:MAG: type II toxin-antitoxin system RelE/ParE family toxin [Bryobacterales bacterium]|nr:type II toxin-antitoxin system RelE/ParE family toxin [Bryobacterales bacterium]